MTRQWKANFELTVEALAAGVAGLGGTMSPLHVRNSAILYRMKLHDDLRPLADAIEDGQPLEPAIGRALMRLITDGRLKFVPRKPGAPEQPDLQERNARIFLAYQEALSRGVSSDDAFEKVAQDFTLREGVSISQGTVRRAVTDWHNRTGGRWKRERERAANPDLIGVKPR
jgi:hypothetical protein